MDSNTTGYICGLKSGEYWKVLALTGMVSGFRKTGLLWVENDGSPVAIDMEQALIYAKTPYRKLSNDDIKREYGKAFSFPDGTIALYDSVAGVLKADKCLAAYHVSVTRASSQPQAYVHR